MTSPAARRQVLVVAALLSLAVLVWIAGEGLSTDTPSRNRSSGPPQGQPVLVLPDAIQVPSPSIDPGPLSRESAAETDTPEAPVARLVGQAVHRLTVNLSGPCELASAMTVLLTSTDGTWSDRRYSTSRTRSWDQLPPGEYRIEALADQHTWTLQPTIVTLGDQQAVSVDVPATAATRTRGRVVDAVTGAPLERATITLQRRQEPLGRPGLSMPDRSVLTDLDDAGGFCLDGWGFIGGVEDPQVRVTVSAEGYASDSCPWENQPMGAFLLDGLVFALEPEAVVSGVVRSAQSGAPVARALVRLEPAESPASQRFWIDGQLTNLGNAGEGLEREQLTDDSGQFRFALAPDRSWRVQALAAEHGSATSAPFSVTSQEAQPIELVLPAGARVVGQVRGEGQQAFAPSQVRLTIADPHSAIGSWYSTLDDSGAFLVGDLQAGSYDLAVQATLKAGSWVVLHEQQLALTEGEHRTVEIVLEQQPGLAVHGQVLHPGDASLVALLIDGDTGQPVGQPAPVAADGRFELRAPRPGPLVCAVTSMPDGHALFLGASPVLVTGGAGQPTVQVDLTRTTLVLEPEQPRAMRWRLQPDTGQPDIDKALHGALAGLRASPPGRLTLHGLPPGRYQVFTTAPDGQAPAEPLSVTLGPGTGEVVGKLP